MTVKVMGLACPRGVPALLSRMTAAFRGLPRKLRSVRFQFQLPQWGRI
jgi:hypothetical protein